MDVYHQVKHRLQAPILAWMFDISRWLPCGVDRWADVRSRDYQNLSDFLGMRLRSCAQRGRKELHYHTQTPMNIFY